MENGAGVGRYRFFRFCSAGHGPSCHLAISLPMHLHEEATVGAGGRLGLEPTATIPLDSRVGGALWVQVGIFFTGAKSNQDGGNRFGLLDMPRGDR
jgi:hypothetical protein